MLSLRRALFALAIAMAVPVCAAQAATFVVDRTDDANASACNSAANDCSLRGAINKANAQAGADTINFDATVFAERQTITLSGLLEISADLSIVGPTVRVTLQNRNAAPLLRVSGGVVQLKNLEAVYSGSPLDNTTDLTVEACRFEASTRGLAVSNSGKLTMRDTIMRADQTALFNTGTLTADRCSIGAKQAIINREKMTLRNCTVGGTYAFASSFGDFTADSCTILGSTINGVEFRGNKISNSIVEVGNRLRGDGGNNLFGDEVKLARLGRSDFFGGLTETIELLPGSVAINAGRTALATDQRGAARPQGGAPDIGAFEVQGDSPTEAPSLKVTTLQDLAGNDGQTSLREAINYANSKPGTNTITFADDLRGTLTLNGTQLPVLTDDTVITGPGAEQSAANKATAVSIEDGGTRIFQIGSGADVTINGLTLTGSGYLNNTNGTIFNEGQVTLNRMEISNNRNPSGAIYNSGGSVILRDSLMNNNESPYRGGSITNINGTVTLINSTIKTIYEAFYSEGNDAQFSLANATVVATRTGIMIAGGGLTLDDSIIVGNEFSADIKVSKGSISSNGHNLVGNAAELSGLAPGDKVGVDPKLGPLADNGGPTFSIALLPGSPAIDAGRASLATDQRGVARPQGSAPDIGAFELQNAVTTPSLIVTTLQDVVASDGQTSLREAIIQANSKAGADTIVFADNVRGSIALSSQLPTVTDALTVNGPGARALSVDGGGVTRLLRIGAGVSVAVADLTLTGGRTAPDDGRGGGVFNQGNLSLRNVAVTGNVGAEGGGIANLNGALALVNSTVSGNTALNSGGGILNNNGVVTLTNSTLSDNTATGGVESVSGGGGLDSFGPNARVQLECVTLAGNSAPNVAGGTRAGVWLENGALVLHNSILSGNGARFGDISYDGGTLDSRGYNIIGGTTRTAGTNSDAPSDRSGIDPKLGPLQDNGGPTQTRALLAGSPAINSGDPAITAGFDQRGLARVRGGRVDAGAFEVQSDTTVVSVSISPRSPATDAIITATPSGFGEGASLSYQWKRNGQVIQGETGSTLDLRKSGNGDKGDAIAVEVTSSEGFATDSVTVINSAPFAVSVRGTVEAEAEIRLPLRGSDADGTAVSFRIVSGPANGTASIEPGASGAATLIYRSRARYNGVEVIRFVAVSDGMDSAPSTAGINVQYSAPPPANRAPVAGDLSVDTFVGEPVVKGLLGSDPDGDALTFRIVNNARYGFSEIRRDTDGQFKLFYTSLNRFYGDDRVTYVAVDSKGAQSNVATINIRFGNRAPVAQEGNIGVASGEPVSQYLFATDADGDALTFRLVNNPRHGTGAVRRDEAGNWRVYYQSVPGYVGTDRISFIAIDPQGRESKVTSVNINVVRVPGNASGSASAPLAASGSGGGA